MAGPGSRFSAVIRIRKTGGINYTKIMGKSAKYKRGTVSTSDKAGVLTVRIEASDSTALRASLNTVMRELHVIESVSRIKLPGAVKFYARPNVQLRKDLRSPRRYRAWHLRRLRRAA